MLGGRTSRCDVYVLTNPRFSLVTPLNVGTYLEAFLGTIPAYVI